MVPAMTKVKKSNKVELFSEGCPVSVQLRKNLLHRWTLVQPISDMNEPLEEIVNAIQEGTNKSMVDIYLGPNFYSSFEKDVDCYNFMETLAMGCPSLAKVSIGSVGHSKAVFTGQAIGSFLVKARKLKHLRIDHHIVLDSQDQVQALAEGLTLHPSLKKVALFGLHLTKRSVTLDPLFKAMSTLPQLELLSLRLSTTSMRAWDESVNIVSPRGFASLASCPQLSYLDLARLNLQDQHMVALLQAISSSPSKIRRLVTSASPRVTAAVWQSVLELLTQSSNCYLEEVVLAFSAHPRIQKECEFYFNLNRNGKRRLLRQLSDKNTWLDRLERLFGCNVDLATLHLLIHDSPYIFTT